MKLNVKIVMENTMKEADWEHNFIPLIQVLPEVAVNHGAPHKLVDGSVFGGFIQSMTPSTPFMEFFEESVDEDEDLSDYMEEFFQRQGARFLETEVLPEAKVENEDLISIELRQGWLIFDAKTKQLLGMYAEPLDVEEQRWMIPFMFTNLTNGTVDAELADLIESFLLTGYIRILQREADARKISRVR